MNARISLRVVFGELSLYPRTNAPRQLPENARRETFWRFVFSAFLASTYAILAADAAFSISIESSLGAIGTLMVLPAARNLSAKLSESLVTIPFGVTSPVPLGTHAFLRTVKSKRPAGEGSLAGRFLSGGLSLTGDRQGLELRFNQTIGSAAGLLNLIALHTDIGKGALNGRHARIWDVASGREAYPALMHQDGVVSASFSPDGKRILTETANSIHLWDATSGKPIRPPIANAKKRDWWVGLGWPSFSPDSKLLVTFSEGKTARIWDTATGQELLPPLAHDGEVQAATFSPNNLLVITSWDKNARLWDTKTGQPLFPPMQHESVVHNASFSFDGKRIITSSQPGIRIWSVATGQPLSLFIGDAVQFSPDGNKLIVGDFWHRGPLDTIDISLDSRTSQEWVNSIQYLFGYQMDNTGGLVPLSMEQLAALERDLRDKCPQDFNVTSQQARAWREHEIGLCLKEGNLDAAQIHYYWLVAEAIHEQQKNTRKSNSANR
jgi:hypothetical protein